MNIIGRSIGRIFWRWEETLAIVALLIVVGSVSFGVFSRYITATPATWAVELASLSFTWMVFLGAAAAFRRNMHVSVDLLTRLAPRRLSRAVTFFLDILLLVFLPYALYLSVLITVDSYYRPSPLLRIPFTYVYLALVLSFGSIFIHHILQVISRLRTKEEAAP